MSLINRPLTFREYLQRIVGDPRRHDEFKNLVDLFGNDKLERVLEGKAMVEPVDFLSGRRKSPMNSGKICSHLPMSTDITTTQSVRYTWK